MAHISPELEVELPPYETPRNAWRETIHHAVSLAMDAANVAYSDEDRLAVVVDLYMTDAMLRFHDVDNRLKDVLDALQGRVGGPKKTRKLPALIPNDKQIFQASVQKVALPAGAHGGGRLRIERIDSRTRMGAV
ncbi:MAG: hypothetical protein ACRDHG_04145 [Anaerolineales bacterium]